MSNPSTKRPNEDEGFELIDTKVARSDESSIFSKPTLSSPEQKKICIVGITFILLVVFLLGWINTPSSGPDDPVFLPIEAARQRCATYNWDIYHRRDRHRKIYDLFMVHAELDWMEIRMEELWDQVDYFIILESPTTFTNIPKRLYVKENYALFEKYHSKMILHTLDLKNIEFKTTWEREYFQRNAMYDQVFPLLKSPQKPNDNDIILVSDVDEVIRPDTLVTLRNCVFPPKLRLVSRFYYYSFQFLQPKGGVWPYPQATFYAGANTVLPQELRGEGTKPEIPEITNASWHCSYCYNKLGDIANKIHSFSHVEFDKEEFTNRSKILHRVRHGLDLFGYWKDPFQKFENNPDIPNYLKENRQKYIYMLDRNPRDGNFIDFVESDGVLN
jgi:beta-1,4-mannosyl-glycoprotein beta-1,4-N-acetylglucosaminyltransferase